MATATAEHAEHLDIRESTAVGTAGPIRADGLVPIHVIRPGVGRGKGRHLYEADMLERNAGLFKGWKMFVDHQAPEAKRAAGGLPRSIRDIGGIVKESWWDPNVPADPAKGHGQGAVVGLCRPTPLIRQLIETDPALVEASISATATAVRPVQKGGQTAWLVEGFNPTGSVDWVSMAGAGGKIAALAEALEESWTDEKELNELLENLSDAEVLEHLKKTRPDLTDLIEAASKSGEPGDAELEETPDEGEEMDPIQVLTEALETDEGKNLVLGLIESAVDERFARIAAPKLAELVEAAIEEERELILAEAEAKANRRVQVRDLRDAAHAQINETKLPETFKAELRARYDLVEGEPTAALDVADEKDEKGVVTKPAEEKLAEAVAAAVKAKELQHAEIAPTTVRGQGRTASEPEDGEGKKEKTPEEKAEEAKSTGSAETDHLFTKAGVELDESLYEGILP